MAFPQHNPLKKKKKKKLQNWKGVVLRLGPLASDVGVQLKAIIFTTLFHIFVTSIQNRKRITKVYNILGLYHKICSVNFGRG